MMPPSVRSLDLKLIDHLIRQREFSLKTFGPDQKVSGVIDHLHKELNEIQRDPNDLMEWIDLILLAFDGAMRQGYSPLQVVATLIEKQEKNENRKWPDWRTADPDKAIEHVRES